MIGKFVSLVKLSHSIFALPFALVGYFIGVGKHGFDGILLLKVIACMILARNAGMAFNRLVDRDIDRLNPRTAKREIASGLISPMAASIFILVNVVAFIALTYTINPICFYLSPIALAVVLLYSLTKRFTALCHLILGIGLGLSPIGAFLAVTGSFATVPILLSFSVLLWVAGFDIVYALQDEQFDIDHKLKSIPAKLGTRHALNVSRVLHLLSVFLLAWAGWVGDFSIWYAIGLGLFSALMIRQHFLVTPTDQSKVTLAFFTVNGVASIGFGFFVILDILT